MRMGIAQMGSRPGDLLGTPGRVAALSERAAARGVDLLLFPLPLLSGPEGTTAPADQEPFASSLLLALSDLSREVACPCVVPAVMSLGDVSQAEAFLLERGRVVPLGAPAWSGDASLGVPGGASEEASTSAAPPVLELSGLRLGLALSYEDLDDYDDHDRDLDAVVFLSPYPYAADDPSSPLGANVLGGRFAADAAATGAWVVAVGGLGGYGEQVYTGGSFVMTPEGELAALAPSFEEQLLVAELPARGDEVVLRSPVEPELFDETLFMWQALCLGLRDYVRKLGLPGVALVLDGSLGSRLLATLSSDALGPQNVHALLPSLGGEARERSCRRLARELGVNLVELPGMAGRGREGALPRLLPFAQLAAYAQEGGLLPVGFLDKTGLSLGGGTSQPGVLLHPLGDVYLSDAVALARLRNAISPVFGELALTEGELPRVEGVEPPRGSRVREDWVARVDAVLCERIEWMRRPFELAEAAGVDDSFARAVLAAYESTAASRAVLAPCLGASTCPVEDAAAPLPFAWHDAAGPVESPLELAQRLFSPRDDPRGGRTAAASPRAADGEPAGPAAEGDDEAHAQEAPRAFDEAISYLRDFGVDAGFGIVDDATPFSGGRQGGGRADGRREWSGPFSDN